MENKKSGNQENIKNIFLKNNGNNRINTNFQDIENYTYYKNGLNIDIETNKIGYENKKYKGKLGENIAKSFLEKNGIKIIDQNYRKKIGEIDLIGIENNTIIFIEVKYRTSKSFGFIEESIDSIKLSKLYDLCQLYISDNNLNCDFRLDFVFINFDKKCNKYEIKWLKNQDFC